MKSSSTGDASLAVLGRPLASSPVVKVGAEATWVLGKILPQQENAATHRAVRAPADLHSAGTPGPVPHQPLGGDRVLDLARRDASDLNELPTVFAVNHELIKHALVPG